MTPEQLKASILQYAVEGKLVKQNPNDEPASELIKKIENEKAELVKEGKIKKSKKLPAITDDEKPFDIPDSWEWVRLGKIGIVTSGGTPRKVEKSYWEDADIPWITPAVMSKAQNSIIFDNDNVGKINQKGLSNSSAQLISANSIVVSSRAPIGYINIVPFAYTTNQGCKSISTYSEVDNRYVYYAIKFSVPDMYKRASGTTFKEISGTRFGETVIPLPPLEEQKRIVAKIEKLMPLVDEYAESYNRLQKIDNEFEDKLKQSVLQYAMEGKLVKQNPSDEPASELIKKIENEKAELIKEGKIKKSKKLPAITDDEKPFDIPDSWEWVRLGNITIYQNGYAYKSSQLTKIKRGLPVIKSQNIMTLNVVIKDNNDYVEQPNDRMLRSQINKGDLLMCLSSQSQNPEPLGKTAIYNLDEPALLNQRVLKLKLIDQSMTKLVFYFINSPWFHYTVSHKGSGSGQSNLKLNHVRNMLLPVPPLEEQKRIVTKIEELMTSINKISK